jgi:hypothetical protein
VRLKDELKSHGCAMEEGEFRDLLAETLHQMFRAWNDEQLMRHPIEAIGYCYVIRHRLRLTEFPFELILRTLQNMRKDKEGEGEGE